MHQTLIDILTIVSLALTLPFLVLVGEILVMWYPTVKRSLETRTHDKLGDGIFYGFLANGLDNVYWFIAWSTFLMEPAIGVHLVVGGSAANIIFRQIGGIYAAKQHVDAATDMHGATGMSKHHSKYKYVTAVFLAALLYFFFHLG